MADENTNQNRTPGEPDDARTEEIPTDQVRAAAAKDSSDEAPEAPKQHAHRRFGGRRSPVSIGAIGILVLLFGAKRLPDMARSIGQSARVFKAEARGMKQDEEAAKKDGSKEEPQQLTAGEASAPVNASA